MATVCVISHSGIPLCSTAKPTMEGLSPWKGQPLQKAATITSSIIQRTVAVPSSAKVIPLAL